MKANKKKIITAILVLSVLVLVVGCGDDYSDFTHNAPDGSTITFDPSSITISATGDTWHPISVTVRDAKDLPMNGMTVVISGAFAYPYAPTHYYFYDSTQTTQYVSGFTGVTDSAGVYKFSILILASDSTGTNNVFTEKIEARSGTAFGSMDVTKD
ncbi:MAG: hypothetical protein ACYC7L_14265 [Nitrospirota bacterium]